MMTTSDQSDGTSFSEAGKAKPPKPPLGPPHDTYATLILTLGVAAAFFTSGVAQGSTLGWVGMLVSLTMAVAAVFYLQRAYGFASRGWGPVPVGARSAGAFCFVLVYALVPSALYEQYFQDSLFAYTVTCLAVAALPIAILRGALGKASVPEPTD